MRIKSLLHPSLITGNHLNGQSMDALGHQVLYRIIHKAMAVDAAEWRKRWVSNSDPEMGALPQSVGARMTRMVCALIHDLQACGLELGL